MAVAVIATVAAAVAFIGITEDANIEKSLRKLQRKH